MSKVELRRQLADALAALEESQLSNEALRVAMRHEFKRHLETTKQLRQISSENAAMRTHFCANTQIEAESWPGW